MDNSTLTALASIAAIIAVLYAMLIGQKSLLEWWRENHPPVVPKPAEGAQNQPAVPPMRQAPPVQRAVRSRSGTFANLLRIFTAWWLYRRAEVEVHPDFYRLLIHAMLRSVVLLGLVGGPIVLLAILGIRALLQNNQFLGMGPTPTPTSAPAPGTYKIIVAAEGTIEVVDCDREVRLTSDEPVHFRISSNRAGEPKWQSLAQDKVVLEQIFAYTPGEFIDGEYDVISYYSDGVLQCSLRVLRANSP